MLLHTTITLLMKKGYGAITKYTGLNIFWGRLSEQRPWISKKSEFTRMLILCIPNASFPVPKAGQL
jgi:methionine synthase I (cobalamin-dependent)